MLVISVCINTYLYVKDNLIMAKLPTNEYAPFYRPYIEALVKNDKSILDNLENTYTQSMNLLKDLPEEKQLFRYADGKWTVKELIQHLIDSERILSYRALRFARRDTKDLPGFEEGDYVLNSDGNGREYIDLLEEFSSVRKSSILLYKSFDKNALLRIGKANGSVMSVRALGYIISGHLQHHLNIINERYL